MNVILTQGVIRGIGSSPYPLRRLHGTALRRTSHAVYDTKYHLVWCPKYRKDLFAQEHLSERAAELFREIAEEYEYDIEEMEVTKDHVYLFLSFPPKYSIGEIVSAATIFLNEMQVRGALKRRPCIVHHEQQPRLRVAFRDKVQREPKL